MARECALKRLAGIVGLRCGTYPMTTSPAHPAHPANQLTECVAGGARGPHTTAHVAYQGTCASSAPEIHPSFRDSRDNPRGVQYPEGLELLSKNHPGTFFIAGAPFAGAGHFQSLLIPAVACRGECRQQMHMLKNVVPPYPTQTIAAKYTGIAPVRTISQAYTSEQVEFMLECLRALVNKPGMLARLQMPYFEEDLSPKDLPWVFAGEDIPPAMERLEVVIEAERRTHPHAMFLSAVPEASARTIVAFWQVCRKFDFLPKDDAWKRRRQPRFATLPSIGVQTFDSSRWIDLRSERLALPRLSV